MLRVYLFLTLLGVLLPYASFLPWVSHNGLNVLLLFKEAVETPISLFAWLDVIISALALLCFIVVDGRKHQIKHRWLPFIGTLIIGVSCGLPFYLYLREKQLKCV